MKIFKKTLPILLLSLTILSVLAFSGCVESTYNDLMQKLDKKGYATNFLEEGINGAPGADAVLIAVKGKGVEEEYLRAYYFPTEDDAINYYEGQFVESVRRFKEENPDLASQLKYGRVGFIVLFGTNGGYNDALA
ncbi:MAG: hypothetical protein IKM44_03315 [Clostridia bacterium]|nr:hypothetical protein [Clostridia bacterium]